MEDKLPSVDDTSKHSLVDKTSLMLPAPINKTPLPLLVVGVLICTLVAGLLAVLLFFSIIPIDSNVGINTVDTTAASSYVTASSSRAGSEPAFTLREFFPSLENFDVRFNYPGTYAWIRGAESFFRLNTVTSDITQFSVIVPDKKIQLGTFAVSDEYLIFNYGSGFGVLDTQSGRVRFFSTIDGLIDANNLVFTLDAVDKNIVWIGTFRGLSKFNVSTHTFENYDDEIGIPGEAIEPRVFYTDNQFVWVTASANSYTSGGVARLDKVTNQWESWSTETFNRGDNPTRVDISYGSAGNDQAVVVEDDNIFYLFDKDSQTWSVLSAYKQGDPIRQITALVGDWLQFLTNNQLHLFNITTQETKIIDYVTLYKNKTKMSAALDPSNIQIAYDKQSASYTVRARDLNYNPQLLTLKMMPDQSVESRIFSTAPYLDLFRYVSATVLDSDGDQILLDDQREVFLYDISKGIETKRWNKKELLAGGWQLSAKLYNNEIVFHAANLCDGMCLSDIGYIATTTMFDRSTGAVRSVTSFTSTSSNAAIEWGDSRHDLSLSDGVSTYVLQGVPPQYERVEDSALPKFEYASDGTWVDFTDPKLPGKLQYIKSVRGYTANQFKMKFISDEGVTTDYSYPLATTSDAFGNKNGYRVSKVTYYDGQVWLATEKTLMMFDVSRGKLMAYTYTDGIRQLGSNFYIGNKLIIDSQGVYIYDYPRRE